jgi:hypothetical protein
MSEPIPRRHASNRARARSVLIGTARGSILTTNSAHLSDPTIAPPPLRVGQGPARRGTNVPIAAGVRSVSVDGRHERVCAGTLQVVRRQS